MDVPIAQPLTDAPLRVLEVFAFDERDVLCSLPQPGTWHWSELPMVLSWWANRHLGPAPDLQNRACLS